MTAPAVTPAVTIEICQQPREGRACGGPVHRMGPVGYQLPYCIACGSRKPGAVYALATKVYDAYVKDPELRKAAALVLAKAIVEALLRACDTHGPIAPRYADDIVVPIILHHTS